MMKSETMEQNRRDTDGCIFCLKQDVELTAEHIFPEAAGGRIKQPILCGPCNSRLGRYVDAPFLRQKYVELARASYRLPGKTGQIPQPFSDTHSVDVLDGNVQIRLDKNFVPRTLPQPPKVWITENQEVGLSVSVDEQDRSRLPQIIRTTLTRFFRTEAALALGLSSEEQVSMIQRSIDQAMQIKSCSIHISTSLRGTWVMEMGVLYAELVKVIYEVGYLEFGKEFLETYAAEKLRLFLLAQCNDVPTPWDLQDMQKHLQVWMTTGLPAELDELTKFLCRGNRQAYHLAIAAPKGVVCSLLNITAIFSDVSLEKLGKSKDDIRIYVNSVTDDDIGVFSLQDRLEHIAPKDVDR